MGVSAIAAMGLGVLMAAQPATAADHVIGASKLLLKKSTSSEKLVFVSKDAAFGFPAIGGADDPVSGAPGGVTVELLSKAEGIVTLTAPSLGGDPGWVSKPTGGGLYRYRNKAAPGGGSPIRVLLARSGRSLKVKARGIGLMLDAPQQSLGIRVSFGGTRTCALFTGASVVKDEAGRFVGKKAVASALADCSDAALLQLLCGETTFPTCGGSCADGLSCVSLDNSTCQCIAGTACEAGVFPACGGDCPAGSLCSTQDLETCTCIPDSAACGATFPVCNGECPPGDECADIGGAPLNNCGCIPEGQSGCPTGLEWNCFQTNLPQTSGCECGPPGPCGSGGDDCPVGFICSIVPGSAPECFPKFCGGSYPTCGGTCDGGDVCMPFGQPGTFLGCLCAPPGLSCESTCGNGMECPAGEACLQDPVGGNCGCSPF